MSEKIKERLMKDEYEIQHFGFSSYDFISQLQNVFHLRVDESLEDLEKAISGKLELEKPGKDKLHSEITSTANWVKNIVSEQFKDKDFQEKIRSFINIPDNIVLTDDLIHNEDFGNDTVEGLRKEIEDLEKEYKKEKLLCTINDQELNIFSQLVPVEEKFNNVNDEINNWPKLTHLKRINDKENTKIAYLSDIKKAFMDSDLDNFDNLTMENFDKNDKCLLRV